jgi:DNA polymerase III gamma/tau subunit
MGRVAEQARFKPTPPSTKRVFILDEAQRLTTQAMQLLLKPFEEPAPSTIWMICTTEPNKILATLRRRCVTHSLNPLSIANVEAFLKRYVKHLGIETNLGDLAEEVHTANVNSPAMLLMVLEKVSSGLAPKQAVSGLSEASVSSLAVCKAVSSGDWGRLRTQLAKTSNEEARFIRASVAGWLRGMLLKESNSRRRTIVATALTKLCSADAPLDDQTLMFWLTGVLHEICHQLRRGSR